MATRRSAALLALLAVGCGAKVRGEILFFIDTDLRVPAEDNGGSQGVVQP